MRFQLLVALFLLGMLSAAQAQSKIKVGFIYHSPINDFGWTNSHDNGRLAMERNLPWVETSYVESVNDGDVESVIDQMASQGIKVIFSTSTSFTDGTITGAAEHPDILFFLTSGYKRAPNVATYMADDYQCKYLWGLASGALSKSGKIGFVSTYPQPVTIRGIDAFTLGVRAVNSQAVVNVRWVNAYYDPVAGKECAEALLAQNCDVLMSDMNSPTVAQVAEAHHVPVNGEAFDASSVAPNSLMANDVFDWGPAYTKLLQQVHDGVLTAKNLQTVDLWWRLGDHALRMYYKQGVFINPKYKEALMGVQADDGTGHRISVYDLIQERLNQMSSNPPTFEPFTGPLVDFGGNMRVAAGQTASREELFSLHWRLPGVIGNWPTP